jgi:Domain of unknown function (DUF4249)
MYKLNSYITGLSLLLLLASCEKVIDVELDEGAKKYVIEGSVSNLTTQPPKVIISQTKKFEDDNTFNGISGAVVTIQVNNGTVYSLPEISTGVYQANTFTGTPGSSYKLSVTISGSTYTAVSIMPPALVSLDTITAEDFAFGGSTSKTIKPSYLDPTGPGNSYRFIQYANGVQTKKVFVQNDDLSDGLRITRPLLDQDSELETGDLVKVEMLCIDPAVYKYWYSLDQAATGANQSATPANPVSNISGGVLGYFSAHSITSRTTIVP